GGTVGIVVGAAAAMVGSAVADGRGVGGGLPSPAAGAGEGALGAGSGTLSGPHAASRASRTSRIEMRSSKRLILGCAAHMNLLIADSSSAVYAVRATIYHTAWDIVIRNYNPRGKKSLPTAIVSFLNVAVHAAIIATEVYGRGVPDTFRA